MQRFVIALITGAFLAIGCGAPGPEVIVPAGVTSKKSAELVTRMMLFEISQNERTLGRSLAEPRIIRVQLLRPGEMYPHRRLDGTNPGDISSGPSSQPGWMVEAVGTFIDTDRHGLRRWGTHGFRMWEDDGYEGFGFFPCGGDVPPDPSFAEGSCP